MLIKIENSLEKAMRSYVKKWPGSARFFLKILIYPRYILELWNGYLGHIRFGKNYPHPNILILGLPKSGTTWLEKMLAGLPGFQSTMFPGMLFFGLKEGESINYDIPSRYFSRNRNKLLVVKTHSHLSDHNLEMIKINKIKYVFMYRDLRDVAISYVHFVSNRPWHPMYPFYNSLSLEDGLLLFSRELGRSYADWIIRSLKNIDSNGIVVTYEQMHQDPTEVFLKVCSLCEIQISKEEIEKMIKKFTSSKDLKEAAHFRAGETGGWKKVFSEKVKDAYKESIGDALLELEYEQDHNW